MFDALDKTLLIDKSASFVDGLYQGSMYDYIQCKTCFTKRQRLDTFLDISLDISASNTLEDAIHKFVQPELMDGNNQYKCEKCGMKVDATKGLCFRSLPSILTVISSWLCVFFFFFFVTRVASSLSLS